MKAKNVALYGVLLALAMILSYVELLIPLSIAVPGVKIGLPNIVTVYALYKLHFRDAAAVSLVRAVFSSILFGNVFSMVYSLAGAVLSFVIMHLLKKTEKFSIVGVSVAGGAAHNVGQIIVAIVVLETAGLVSYLPVLLVSGVIAGIIVGLIGALIVKRIDSKIISR